MDRLDLTKLAERLEKIQNSYPPETAVLKRYVIDVSDLLAEDKALRAEVENQTTNYGLLSDDYKELGIDNGRLRVENERLRNEHEINLKDYNWNLSEFATKNANLRARLERARGTLAAYLHHYNQDYPDLGYTIIPLVLIENTRVLLAELEEKDVSA